MRIAIHAWISGRVQGVFFRASTLQVAQGLELDGWVRNLPDGRVELMACGTTKQIERLQEWLPVGPPQARVENVRTKVVEPDIAPGSGFEFR